MKKIDDIRLEVADNGYILRYTKLIKRGDSSNDLTNMERDYVEEVYTNEQADVAVAKMKELKNME